MGRLGEAMQALRAKGKKAFVPYLTSGDPDMPTTKALWHALDRAGADVIEVGVPFSDPLADGPTIQRASERALRSGTTLRGILEAVREERARVRARLVIFSYYNPILACGVERFAEAAHSAGVDGVLVPDLLPEEAGQLKEQLGPRGIDLVFLASPTTSEERLELLGGASPALVYAVSLTGVTGARDGLPPRLGEFLARARRHISAPIIVGFGIATPEQASAVSRIVDGVVVGSALVRLVEEGPPAEIERAVERLARELAGAVKGPARG